MLYNPKEGTFQRKLGDFSGCQFLANSGNWLLLFDSGSNLYIVDAVKHCSMAVKTEVSKTYDRLKWSFIRYVFERMGFYLTFVG